MKKVFLLLVCIIFLMPMSFAYSVEFFHSDHLGSPSVVSSGSGSVVWSADYDVFGETLNVEGSNKVNYNSKERDATGLLYYGSRYYNPLTGRFISADTVKGDSINTQSQNRYIYVKNNPLRYTDPTGHQSVDADRTRFVIYNFIQTENWGSMMKPHIAEINSVSKQTGVPGEAILSAMLVEDIRFYEPDDASFTKESAKAWLRQLTPNAVLVASGHKANTDNSYLGMINSFAFIKAVDYLETLPDLDAGTKQLLNEYRNYEQNPPEGFGGRLAQGYAFDQVDGPKAAAIVLKSHMEYWNRAGYDFMSGDFKTVSTFGERMGALETINNIANYYPDGYYHEGSGSAGFYTKRGVKKTPHDSPGLGGTPLWGYSDYGTVTKEFVDSGLATVMLNEP